MRIFVMVFAGALLVGCAASGPTPNRDEFVLTDEYFSPPLDASFRAYLRSQLGPAHAQDEIAISRLSVRIKKVKTPPPQAHPVAGLVLGPVFGVIATAIVDPPVSFDPQTLVLVAIEGTFAGRPFAGFANATHQRRESIDSAVHAAFAEARDSVRARIP